jgi:DNA-binding beta-propeller fold protein YncE
MKTKIVNQSVSFAGLLITGLLMAGGASAQNMFVDNWYNPGAIYEFTPGSMTPTTYFSGFTADLGEPDGMAFNSSGYLYVADSLEGNIDVISPGGGSESTFATGLPNPTTLAFDAAGDLFEADNHGNAVYEFVNHNGTLSSSAQVFKSGLNGPCGVAFDSSGDLFESDNGSGNVYEFAN